MTGTTRRLLAGPDKFDPKSIGNLAAAYDFTQPSTTTSDKLRASATGSISLCADTSGNSNVNVLALNGVAGNFASAPDEANIAIGDFYAYIDMASVDYTPATEQVLISHWNSTGNQRSFYWYLDITTGRVASAYSADGTVVGYAVSTEAIPSVVDFARVQLRLRRVASTGVITYWYSTDQGLDWTQLGIDRPSGVTGNLYDTTAGFHIGQTTANTATMLVYSASINSDISTKLIDFNFVSATKLAASFVCATGQTVTINSTGATGARICGARDTVNLVAASMPTLLTYGGTNYGYLNGVAGNWITTPDASNVDFTTALDAVFRIRMPSYIPSATMAIASKWDGGAQKSYIFELQPTTGRPNFGFTTNGSTDQNRAANANPNLTNGAIYWMRYVFTGDNGASGHDVAFYFQVDTGNNIPPTAGWTQIGTTVTTAGTRSIHVGTDVLGLGGFAAGTLERFNGEVFYAEFRATSGGVAAASFDPTRYVSGTTLSSATGETWTLNGGATIVTRQCASGDGVDDFVKSAAYPCPQPTTLYWAGSMNSWTSADYLVDGNATNSGALIQTTTTPQVNINAGSSVAANTNAPLKTWGIFCAVLNGANSTLRWMRLPVTTGDAGTASMNGTTLLANGAAGAGWMNGCIGKVLQFSPAAHSVETQNRIVAALARELRIPLT